MTQGRPSLFTPELAEEICRRLTEGQTLREICRAENMPSESTVRLWVMDDRDGFSAQYMKAREVGYQSMADELMEIADDARNDWMLRRQGDDEIEVVNSEHIQRSRLRVDTRKWMLSKALPKIYGDKVALTDPDGGALTINVVQRRDGR